MASWNWLLLAAKWLQCCCLTIHCAVVDLGWYGWWRRWKYHFSSSGESFLPRLFAHWFQACRIAHSAVFNDCCLLLVHFLRTLLLQPCGMDAMSTIIQTTTRHDDGKLSVQIRGGKKKAGTTKKHLTNTYWVGTDCCCDDCGGVDVDLYAAMAAATFRRVFIFSCFKFWRRAESSVAFRWWMSFTIVATFSFCWPLRVGFGSKWCDEGRLCWVANNKKENGQWIR